MERGIYFDGWIKDNHCYHPSMPMRSMQMIDDIEKYRGTMLVWSALGGGSISLPYLEHEAFGDVDPRQRFYGYMNDSEYIAECTRRGIKVFGIIFEVQGWEFPAIVKDNKLKRLNVLSPSETTEDWYGLREFSQGKQDKVFDKSLYDYFPNGLINSDREEVNDLWEEVAARDYNGTPIHAQWVEVTLPGHKQVCYQTCRNNPVWREYMKKVIEIQIDAGVAGVQLDESELPITSLRHGGCFCKDCRKQFTEYLVAERSRGRLDKQYDDIELEDFDYGEWLKARNIGFPEDPNGVPLFREYWEFQMRNVKKFFTEMTDYIRDYGNSQGREVLRSGNFFNGMPVYYPILDSVDVVTTEMERTLFKQPFWYRYINGFSGDKPAIVVENPYGGIIPELFEMLEDGKGYDLYRLFLLEASAYGCNMAVPYGGWMGNTIKTAFYPPRNVTEEVQDFLADNEKLFSKKSGASICVLYSWPSYYWRESTKSSTGNVNGSDESILFFSPTDIDDPNTTRLPFWEIIKNLSDNKDIYDIHWCGDGEDVPENLDIGRLNLYETVILPDCDFITENQAEIFEKYVSGGGRLLVFGECGENIDGFKEKLIAMDGVVYCENPENKTKAIQEFRNCYENNFADTKSVIIKSDEDIGVQLHLGEDGTKSLHILNYSFDSTEDKTKVIEKIELEIDIPFKKIKVYSPDKNVPEISVNGKNVVIHNMPIYVVLEFCG